MQKKSFIADIYNIIIISVALTIFVSLTILITTKNEQLNLMDSQIAEYFVGKRVRFWDYIFVIVSYMGETKTILALCIILIFLPNRKHFGIPITVLTVISAILNLIIKIIVARARPDGYFLNESTLFYSMPTSYSFPSGHSQTANLFYFSVLFLSIKYINKNAFKIILTIILTVFCFLMGLSRIYLGVHFFSDVLAGICLMIFILSTTVFIFRKTSNLNFEYL